MHLSFVVQSGLTDKRITITSVNRSILFSFHPFANIWSAILKLNANRLATREEAHRLAIDYHNVFQV